MQSNKWQGTKFVFDGPEDGAYERFPSFVNLTPHPLTVRLGEGYEKTLPPSGQVARVVEHESGQHEGLFLDLYDLDYCGGDTPGPAVPQVAFGPEVEGLPPAVPLENEHGERVRVYYVVSLLTALMLRAAGKMRPDILIPGKEVRDAQGRIVACQGLRRLA